jgi:hypothetical protein
MMSGCSPSPRTLVFVPAVVSCQEAIDSNLRTISDTRLAELLDDGLVDGDLDACWNPLMKMALEQQRDLPRRHLAEAVAAFNQRRHAELFHTAVSRYLSSLPHGEYHQEDRRLLEAYARYAIDHATSRSDGRLRDVRLLCAQLDVVLYNRIFE